MWKLHVRPTSLNMGQAARGLVEVGLDAEPLAAMAGRLDLGKWS
jgi:hypothetical protein